MKDGAGRETTNGRLEFAFHRELTVWCLPMRGCADAGGMEEVTLFKRKVSDRSTVTPDFVPMSPSLFVLFVF